MRFATSIGLVLALLPFAARSEYEQTFGDVTVHYSALPTERLLPAMAKRYGIVRSRDRGLVNIAIEHKPAAGDSTPVRATVTGRADSVGGERAALRFRELVEEGTVSYISEFPVNAPDTYTFTITVTPEGSTPPHTLKFSQDFAAN